MSKFIKFINNIQFRKKLFISYFIVCIIPIIVLGIYSNNTSNNFLRIRAKQALNESMRLVANNLSFRFQQYELVINSVVYNFRFQQIFSSNSQEEIALYSDYIDPFFNNILFLHKDILQITAFTENPDIVRGDYILPIDLIKDTDWFAKSIQSRKICWLDENRKILGTRMIYENNLNRIMKPTVLFLSINVQELLKCLEDIKHDTYGVIILDSENKIAIERNKNNSVNLDIKNMPELNKSDGFFKIGNKEYMFVQTMISPPGWKMIYYMPVGKMTEDTTNILGATIIIIGFCILVLIFIIWAFSYTFVKRIDVLNKKMEIIENGDLKVNITSSSKDEIGVLTNRLGRMIGFINRLIDEAYQSKIVQKEAEMKALQAQINPHFLYNTLSIINWKAIQVKAMEISHITNNVSKYYRTVLNKGKSIIPITGEVENARAYIEIQLIMHNYNFEFHCNIHDEIYKYDMINLILQPIIENAIEHGIEKKRTGKGILNLSGDMIENDIIFVIEDNGPGMSDELSENILTKETKGYGVKNVDERIKIFFGSSYGLKIVSKIDKGTKVLVCIPKYKEGL